MIKLIKKYNNIIKYLINGGVTTVINFSAYLFLERVLDVHYLVANLIAWILSVIYAFITNKIIVFKDERSTFPQVLRQFMIFTGLRAVSFGLEELSMLIFITQLRFNDIAVKLIIAVAIVITNYIFSKFIIFKNKKDI